MDQPDTSQRPIFSDRVTVNGAVTPLTLSADGVIRWSEGGQRCLTVEKEVLGFSTDGPKIKIRALVDTGDRICCSGRRGALVRKHFVFEFFSEDSQRLFCQKLREYIDSLGNIYMYIYLAFHVFGRRESERKLEMFKLLEMFKFSFPCINLEVYLFMYLLCLKVISLSSGSWIFIFYYLLYIYTYILQ